MPQLKGVYCAVRRVRALGLAQHLFLGVVRTLTPFGEGLVSRVIMVTPYKKDKGLDSPTSAFGQGLNEC